MLEQQNSLSHSLGEKKFEIKVSAGSLSEATLLGLYMATFSLCSYVVLLYVHIPCVSSDKHMGPIRSGPHPYDLIFCLDYLLKGPTSKYNHIGPQDFNA